MSGSRVLFDEPGPRGRKIIAVVTAVTLLLIAAVVYLAVRRFADNGQLDAVKWKPFVKAGIPTFIWNGLLGTLKVTAMGAVFAFPLGALLALARLSANRYLRWAGTGWIEIFRSTPLLLLIFIFVLTLPGLGVNLPPYWKLVIPIVLSSSAVLAEVFRAGIQALPRGQSEAGLAIGLTPWQTMRLVVLPQAIRIIVPSLVTQLVALLKDSTLAYAASYSELLNTAQNLTASFHNFIQSYLVVGMIYVVLNGLLSYLARVLERRLSRGARSGALGGRGGVNAAAPVEAAESLVAMR